MEKQLKHYGPLVNAYINITSDKMHKLIEKYKC